MNRLLALIALVSFVTMSFAGPKSQSVRPSDVTSTSLTLRGLSDAEFRVVQDAEFLHFIRVLALIEDNYRKAGTLNTKKMMVAALKGIMAEGTGDKYSKFFSPDEATNFMRENAKGEKTSPNKKIKEEVFVRGRSLSLDLAYLAIARYPSAAIGQFDKAVVWLKSIYAKGLIIDLRGNPGGMTNVNMDILCYLIPEGQIIARFQSYQQGTFFVRAGRDAEYRGNKKLSPVAGVDFLRTIPIVILINGLSASASELMVGALRGPRGAKVVGTKSYGKGSFWELMTVHLGMIQMTTGRWFTPNGQCVDGVGIEPDYKVEDTRSKICNRDAQLEKAIEVLRSLVNKKVR